LTDSQGKKNIPLGDNQITVVERGAVQLDEDVIISNGGDFGFLELELVEAVFLALDGPLLLGSGCHCELSIASRSLSRSPWETFTLGQVGQRKGTGCCIYKLHLT
jgi:hypothetical protein